MGVRFPLGLYSRTARFPGRNFHRSGSALSAALVLCCLFHAMDARAQGQAVIPRVLDLPADDAQKLLERQKFRVVRQSQPSARATGTVIDVQPKEGERIARGSVVTLTVAAKRDDVVAATVPAVIGMPLGRAVDALRQWGLTARVTDRRPSADHKRDTVVAQDPGPGRPAPPDKVVALAITVPLTVPRVTGMPVGQAETILRRLGLGMFRLKDLPTGDYAPGIVAAQTPRDGERPPADKRVGVAVAVPLAPPKPAPSILVPNVVGMALSQAQAELEDAGLVARRGESLESDVAVGTVLVQEPAADARVRRGAAITLTIARAPRISPPPRPPPPPAGPDYTYFVVAGALLVALSIGVWAVRSPRPPPSERAASPGTRLEADAKMDPGSPRIVEAKGEGVQWSVSIRCATDQGRQVLELRDAAVREERLS